ncbi:MAG: DNA repair protein RecN [Alphaproteobacteria bacterium]
MLRHLSIRDVVLIDRLDLDFSAGLGVLTGETGAGKSILLDSLGLVLGARGGSSLVRAGCRQAVVSADFDVAGDREITALLVEHGLDSDDGCLVLRRVLGADGRSRAFLNDQSISIGLLRDVGMRLVDVHGQFEHHGLLNPRTHGVALDAFGVLDGAVGETRAAHGIWLAANETLLAKEASLAKAQEEEVFLRHALEELDDLVPEANEEAALAERRQRLQHGEKLVAASIAAQAALGDDNGADRGLQLATRELARVGQVAGGLFDGAMAALDRAAAELAEVFHELHVAEQDIDVDPGDLDEIERRLFALRGLARKHGCEVDGLAALHDSLRQQLLALDDAGSELTEVAARAEASRRDFVKAAENLSRGRQAAAKMLDKSVAGELPPLKLGNATFTTEIARLDEARWGPMGCDEVRFTVATNPGATPGPIHKIASGGELSRFMLALKVVLADSAGNKTLVFDEVDAGVGGATAAAVGQRLARLSEERQVLVVTHSPQVAAVGVQHWRVAKREEVERVVTEVAILPQSARQEEIARMISGAEVTDEARAAAARLMAGT